MNTETWKRGETETAYIEEVGNRVILRVCKNNMQVKQLSLSKNNVGDSSPIDYFHNMLTRSGAVRAER